MSKVTAVRPMSVHVDVARGCTLPWEGKKSIIYIEDND